MGAGEEGGSLGATNMMRELEAGWLGTRGGRSKRVVSLMHLDCSWTWRLHVEPQDSYKSPVLAYHFFVFSISHISPQDGTLGSEAGGWEAGHTGGSRRRVVSLVQHVFCSTSQTATSLCGIRTSTQQAVQHC